MTQHSAQTLFDFSGLTWLRKRLPPLLCALGISVPGLSGTYADASTNQEILFHVSAGEIPIRDPFIHADPESGLYYLYARTAFDSTLDGPETALVGVQVYLSRDLVSWSEPLVVLSLPESHWARDKVWAPEVHLFQGRYYLFVTLTSNERLADQGPAATREGWPELVRRGTQIFVGDSPTGPFEAFENQSHTPVGWMSVDGTLWVEDGEPFMVFCHAWQQIEDGTMNVVPLSSDLSRTLGDPQILFRGSDAPWANRSRDAYVTNGPYLHRLQDGKLILIWSAFGKAGYCVGQAVSESGSLHGPWVQSEHLLFDENGGHASLFVDLKGELKIVLHQPNSPRGSERMRIFAIEERFGRLNRIDRPLDISPVDTGEGL